jgi:hypothetical protein
MTAKKKGIRSVTGTVIDQNTVKTTEPMDTLKLGDVVVIMHAEDYKRTFESMMKRINEMDEKIDDQSKLLNENIIEKKGFLKRFKK